MLAKAKHLPQLLQELGAESRSGTRVMVAGEAYFLASLAASWIFSGRRLPAPSGSRVILLTGNGHARRDIGVQRHLKAAERQRGWSIGLIEAGSEEPATFYDVAFLTPRHERADPCAALRPKERQQGPPV